jgi:hypothetical protein
LGGDLRLRRLGSASASDKYEIHHQRVLRVSRGLPFALILMIVSALALSVTKAFLNSSAPSAVLNRSATSTPNPTHTVLTSTLTLTSANNGQTLNNYRIRTTSGPCVIVSGATNVTIENFQIGPCGTNHSTSQSQGVYIYNGSSNINIYDSYIHVEKLASGCCDTHDGIFVNGSNVTIQGNVLAFNESNIETEAANTVADGNFSLNPRGPFPRGQHWQSLSGATNVVYENNRTLSCEQASNVCGHPGSGQDKFCLACSASTMSSPTPSYFAVQEDAVNFYRTNGVTASGNWIEGGDSPSGQGIELDDHTTGTIAVTSNVMVNTGHGCIGPQQGGGRISGNECQNSMIIDHSQNGMYISNNGYTGPCGPWTLTNNRFALLAWNSGSTCNPATTGCYFNSGGYGDGSCSFTTGVGNTFDNRFSPNPAPVGGDPVYVALNPIATTKPPPLIPPLPKNCVVTSPYSTQTSLPPCSRGTSRAQSSQGKGF